MKTINRFYLAAAALLALGSISYVASASVLHKQISATPASEVVSFGGNPPPCGPYPYPPCPTNQKTTATDSGTSK